MPSVATGIVTFAMPTVPRNCTITAPIPTSGTIWPATRGMRRSSRSTPAGCRRRTWPIRFDGMRCGPVDGTRSLPPGEFGLERLTLCCAALVAFWHWDRQTYRGLSFLLANRSVASPCFHTSANPVHPKESCSSPCISRRRSTRRGFFRHSRRAKFVIASGRPSVPS